MNVWPNPATDYLNVKIGDQLLSGLAYVTVIGIQGRELIKVPYSERIDISSLDEGIFIIMISVNGRSIGYNRFIKTR